MEDYRRRVLAGDDSVPTAQEAPFIAANRGDQRRAAAQKRAELQPLRNRQKDAEKRMEGLQARIADLDQRLADPDLFTKNPDKGA
jgi:ATP-binding cassette subfamily F protein 3